MNHIVALDNVGSIYDGTRRNGVPFRESRGRLVVPNGYVCNSTYVFEPLLPLRGLKSR